MENNRKDDNRLELFQLFDHLKKDWKYRLFLWCFDC